MCASVTRSRRFSQQACEKSPESIQLFAFLYPDVWDGLLICNSEIVVLLNLIWGQKRILHLRLLQRDFSCFCGINGFNFDVVIHCYSRHSLILHPGGSLMPYWSPHD